VIDLEVKVSGVEQIRANLLGLPPSLRAKLVVALTTSVIEIGAAARAAAPHRTGTLQQSIRTEVREERTKVTGRVFSDYFLARFYESGPKTSTVDVKAHVRHAAGHDVHALGKRGQPLKRLSHVGVSTVRAYTRVNHLQAHPFMRPAFDSLRARVEARIEEAVAAAVAEANR
jgi:HK97 gp10 family phage protein